jgi:acetyltransferase-like isoleucine patch superfamily enzyme
VKQIGPGLRADDGVILGYMPGRKIDDTNLVIGANAQIRAGSIIYGGTRIGDDFETGHNVVIREENQIGDHVSIWNNTVIDYGCVLGNGVKIHCNIYVAQFTVLEDDVFMAPGVTIANDMHPGCEHSRECMRGPTIKRGAQLGVNVTVLPFITIGERAVIGSGSVVTRDIPAGMVAYGNPARPVRPVTELKCVTGITDKPYG